MSSCSTEAERQTDVTKLTVAFRNFANVPTNKLSVDCNVLSFTFILTTRLRTDFIPWLIKSNDFDSL